VKELWKVALAVVFFFTGIWFYRLWREHLKKQIELIENRRRALIEEFDSIRDKLRIATSEFSVFLTPTTGYFTNYQVKTWCQNNTGLYGEIKSKVFDDALDSESLKLLNTFKDYFTKSEEHRTRFNANFIPSELRAYSDLFDNIENRKLDLQQRTAIVTDEDNNIIIAGAGSGKTTTIVGKVQYVLDRYKIRSEEILLISFTNKSATTLSSRLQIDGIEAKTFHKFGKDIIAHVDEKQPSIYDEKQFPQFVISTFNSLIQDPAYLQKVTDYFTDFIKPEKSQFEFESQGDYIQYLKDQNFRPYEQIQPDGHQTLRREIVKSIEECKIANFLLFNRLSYKYEFPYEHDTATPLHSRWRPDFTITQNGRTIYIEHFAVDRNGNVPRFFAKSGEAYEQAKNRYREKMEWARQRALSDGTTLVETFSYEMFEGNLYENLKRKLEAHGIVLNLMPPNEVWRIVREAAKDEVSSFIQLFQTFITLMKSNNYSINDLISRNNKLNQAFLRRRNARFLDIISPIFTRYENELASRSEIDFSDMINRATQYIRRNSFRRKFSYIIIDEFQDISIGRYHLIKALKDANPSCKLFCVGDDWQSIYRFTGSDIALFKDFERFFGYTIKSKIETTYRFHNPALGISSEFIQKNPNQVRKELRSAVTGKTSRHEIKYSISEPGNQDDTAALRRVLDDLATEPNVESKEILLLGRYKHDITRIKNDPPVFQIQRGEESSTILYERRLGARTLGINLHFLTVHKAKGLEADIVIVINCNSGKHGFPSEMSDDPVLNLLLSESDQFENGEERRLFYVAMTRAKERTYFIADSSFKSKFIKELEVGSTNEEIMKCPWCVTADLVKRSGETKGKRWAFYGCTNSLYGCEYKKWIT
jgi:DNA helicase-4